MKRVALMVVCGLALADAAIGHELFGMHLQNNRAFEQEFVAMERLGVTCPGTASGRRRITVRSMRPPTSAKAAYVGSPSTVSRSGRTGMTS
jgi:hypothetical protein